MTPCSVYAGNQQNSIYVLGFRQYIKYINFNEQFQNRKQDTEEININITHTLTRTHTHTHTHFTLRTMHFTLHTTH